MLKNRVITALVLAPLVVAAILFLPVTGFAVVWGIIILGAAWEWSNLAGLASIGARLAFVGGLLLALVAARMFVEFWAPEGALPAWFYWPIVAWWVVWGIAFRMMPERLVKAKFSTGVKLAAGALVLFSAWALFVWLRLNFKEYQALYLVLLVWLADVGAYFVGKRWGHTKLVPAVSPGKTIEGVYGAFLAVALLAIGVGVGLGFEAITITDFVFLSLITVAVSICGDLFESLAKRIRGVKDSSGLLPGHGGVLDRIDSLLAAVSVFYAGSLMLGLFIELHPAPAESISLPSDAVMEGAPPEEDSGEAMNSSAAPDAHLDEPQVSGGEAGEPNAAPPDSDNDAEVGK